MLASFSLIGHNVSINEYSFIGIIGYILFIRVVCNLNTKMLIDNKS